MNIINNIKEKRVFAALDLSILISNTFIFYGLGMQILSHYHPELKGLFTLLVALFNFICAWLLFKKFKADEKLVYLMIGLTLTFVTLVAPVQLKGNYITLFWAAEAVLLIWLAQKSKIVMYRLVSVIITILMFFSLAMDWEQGYTSLNNLPLVIIFNKTFITSLFSSLSLLVIVLLLRKETEKVTYLSIPFHPQNYSKVLKFGFVVLLYFTGMFELIYQLSRTIEFPVTTVIIAGAYHFLYFTILNGLVTKFKKAVELNYILNFINVAIFVLIFAVLPISDFKVNTLVVYGTNIGFVFHYVSLACILFIIYTMYKTVKQPNSPIKMNPTLSSVLLAIAIVYVASIELLLHVYYITVSNVVSHLDEADYTKLIEIDVIKIHSIQIGFPILWGILAFVFLVYGMKNYNKTLRIVALILLGITLIKLFTYDIKDASEAGKIIAFIILGLVLLIISFMYQKIKALLIDDNAPIENQN